MNSNQWVVGMVVYAVLAVPALMGQGSGSAGPVSSGPSTGTAAVDNPFLVTRTVNATVVEISPKGILVVREVRKDGKEKFHEFRLDARMELSADKKTALRSEKRKLTLADFAAGTYVRVTWRPEDGTAIALRVIPEKAKKG